MKHRIRRPAAMLLCTLAAALLSGCWSVHRIGAAFLLTGESYPDAEAYQAGAMSYRSTEISAVEVYWRSGEIEILESGAPELRVLESGGALPENAAMHTLLKNGVLQIRFCTSGAKIWGSAAKKHLHLEVPAGIDLSIHTTSAPVRADALNPRSLLIAAFSGSTELGAVTAQSASLTSSSGAIHAASVSASSVACSASSGSITLGAVTAQDFTGSTSSGSVRIGALTAETARITTSSGFVRLTPCEVPDAKIQTSSGDIHLILPDGGAALSYASSSGKLRTKRAYERRGNLYVFGRGACRLTAETASGDLEIS